MLVDEPATSTKAAFVAEADEADSASSAAGVASVSPKLRFDPLLLMVAGFIWMLKPNTTDYLVLVGYTVAISFIRFPIAPIASNADPLVATQVAYMNMLAYVTRAALACIHVVVLMNTDRRWPNGTETTVIREMLMRVVPWASALELIFDVPSIISIAAGVNYTMLALLVVSVINCM